MTSSSAAATTQRGTQRPGSRGLAEERSHSVAATRLPLLNAMDELAKVASGELESKPPTLALIEDAGRLMAKLYAEGGPEEIADLGETLRARHGGAVEAPLKLVVDQMLRIHRELSDILRVADGPLPAALVDRADDFR